MTKKFFTFILCLVAAMGISTAAFADTYTDAFAQTEDGQQLTALFGYEIGETAPMVRITDVLSPELTCEELEASTDYRTAVLMKDGEPVGQATFLKQDGKWIITDHAEDGSGLYDAIAKHGNDIIVFGGYGEMYVDKRQPDTVYPLHLSNVRTLPGEGSPVPYADYMSYISYCNHLPQNSDPSIMGGSGKLEYNPETLAAAKAYWAEHSHPKSVFPTGMVFVVAVILAGTLTGIVLYRKKKHA